MMRLLPVAGALLLTIVATLPFSASASEGASAAHPMILAVSRPLTRVVTWPISRPAFHEPGVLLLVGSGLMVVGGWLRRATTARKQPATGGMRSHRSRRRRRMFAAAGQRSSRR
jgi:hypothetical protein